MVEKDNFIRVIMRELIHILAMHQRSQFLNDLFSHNLGMPEIIRLLIYLHTFIVSKIILCVVKYNLYPIEIKNSSCTSC